MTFFAYNSQLANAKSRINRELLLFQLKFIVVYLLGNKAEMSILIQNLLKIYFLKIVDNRSYFFLET